MPTFRSLGAATVNGSSGFAGNVVAPDAPLGRVTARALLPVVAGIDALGHDARRCLSVAGISPMLLEDPEATLPPRAMAGFWKAAVGLTGDEHIGLRIAVAAPIESFDVLAYAMLSSPTVRDAFRRACRYQGLINTATTLTYSEKHGNGVVRHALQDGRPVSRQPAEFLVAAWVRFGRLVAGVDWIPARVHLAHERPNDVTPYVAALGRIPQFGCQFNGVDIPQAMLPRKNPRGDQALAAVLDRYAETLLAKSAARTTVSGQVRAWLVEAHGAGAPSLSRAARALAMSTRSLSRRLAEEGTGFRDVLDQFRRETSVRLLASGRHSIAEIAFLLAYSEMSAFYRAFRRWTGRAPAALRDEHDANEGRRRVGATRRGR